MKIKTTYSSLFLLVGVALLGTFTSVFASDSINSDKSRRFELGPFIGIYSFEDKQNLKDSAFYGGRLGYNFSRHFGVEGSIGVVNAKIDDKSKTGVRKGEYRSPTNNVDMTFSQLNGIYQFTPEKRFSPFVTAGVGNVSYSPQVLDNNSNTIDFGIGAKYWLKRDVALRIDLKDHMDSDFNNYSAAVEVVFALGSRSKNKPDAIVKPEPVVELEPKETVIVSEISPKVVREDSILTNEIKNEKKTIVLTFEDVHFNFDKSTLTEAAKVILKRTIQILKDNPETRVRISGYTSASGSDEYNQRLSERRARSVENYLVNEGFIAADRLSTIGYGEANPAKFEASPKKKYSQAAKANMRVLFETIVD
ncbi:MAG: OmpA family protein [Candidatus Riflebacteria bacterium]|nr:OmpA family protein [Candidatus Riflebacteria bacterium]